jgi:hypothetical protein
MRQGWSLRKVRRTWAQGKVGKVIGMILFGLPSLCVAQRLLLIEPSVDGVVGFDIFLYPQCLNDHGHAAGVLVRVDAQNRQYHLPFVWTPEEGMRLLPEPTTVYDQGTPLTIPIYGVRVLHLTNDGQLLLRVTTDSYLGNYILVGWSPQLGYQVVRSDEEALFTTLFCMPRKWFYSQWITELYSSTILCYGDGISDAEVELWCDVDSSLRIYPFNYNEMKFFNQGSQFVSLRNAFDSWLQIYWFNITAISANGRAIIGGIGSSSPFRIVRAEGTSQWQGSLPRGTSVEGVATAVSADGSWVAGRRRRPDNRYLPFVWHVDINTETIIDIDLPSRQNFVPNFGSVVDMSADGTIIVGNAQQRDQGNIVQSRAYQWTSNRGVEYLDEKYSNYISSHYSFPLILDLSSDGRYMLVRVEGSCAGYGVLDTLGEPLLPDNPTVIMRNETASGIPNAPDARHAYPFVGDRITLAAIVRSNGRYYFSSRACGTELRGRWFVPGHHYRATGGEAPDFDFSDVRYVIPQRIHEWTGRGLRFEWYRTKHLVDQERSLSQFSSGSYWTRLRYGGYILEGRIYHRWYLYDEDVYYADRVGLWTNTFYVQVPGTFRHYVRTPYGRNGRWTGLHQPKPGAWQNPDLDESVFADSMFFIFHKSQNCDESDELALRISVRAIANWISDNPDNLRRKLVEWAASFLNVPYEWGGHWYGGRADNAVQHSDGRMYVLGRRPYQRMYYPGHHDYDGYGVDCSGLVCAAARLAGYSNFQSRGWRRNAEGLAKDDVSYPVPIQNIQPGHLIVKPGAHVAIVYQIHGRTSEETNSQRRWRIQLTYIDACGSGQKVDLHSVTIEAIENKSVIEDAGYNWMIGAQIRALRE